LAHNVNVVVPTGSCMSTLLHCFGTRTWRTRHHRNEDLQLSLQSRIYTCIFHADLFEFFLVVLVDF